MNDPSPTKRPLALLALAEAALALPAFGIAWAAELPVTNWLPSTGGLGPAIARGLLATLPPLAALAWMLRTNWPPAAQFRENVRRMIAALLGQATLPWLILISAAAGIGEELLFRGALQPLLGQWLGPAAGVAAASLLFGLAHPISKTYILLATAMGAYFGAMAILSGEIVSAIIAHGVYDLVALIWLRSLPTTKQA